MNICIYNIIIYIFFIEWQNTVDDISTSDYVRFEKYDELMNENERLKKEISVLKSSALTRDLQIRQEMADTYTSMMKKLEIEWKYVLNLLFCFL